MLLEQWGIVGQVNPWYMGFMRWGLLAARGALAFSRFRRLRPAPRTDRTTGPAAALVTPHRTRTRARETRSARVYMYIMHKREPRPDTSAKNAIPPYARHTTPYTNAGPVWGYTPITHRNAPHDAIRERHGHIRRGDGYQRNKKAYFVVK